MEREILYRAKRKNWKELPKEKWWVEGNLLISDENYYIVPSFGVSFVEELKGYVCDRLITLHAYEVEPETVCRYTGLTNKNGRKIFEGDIVKDEQGNYYKAFWQENYYQFSFICVKAENHFFKDAKWDLWSLAKNYELELCGNIFDNPELLKGDVK